MDYQALRKKYTLYTRGSGILAMVLILCIAVVIRDTLLQTVGGPSGLRRIIAGNPTNQ